MQKKIEEIAKKHSIPDDAVQELMNCFQDAVSSLKTVEPQPSIINSELDTQKRDEKTVITSSAEEGEQPQNTSYQSKYKDVEQLGVGGMGVVRKVEDIRLRRTMAMKVAKSTVMKSSYSLSRFIREAQMTAQLQHPGILPVHEIGNLDDGRVFFTMQEVRGQTLSQVIKAYHKASDDFTLRRLMEIIRKACEAVGYAHSRGVVHRDLKPANIMVGEHGEVLVVDWGLAKVIGSAEEVVEIQPYSDDAFITQMGSIAGTPTYMPPEQAKGEVNRIDARSDVYALGGILYHILAGHPPYRGKDGPEVIRKVVETDPIPLQTIRSQSKNIEIPSELIRICEVAMAKDMEKRFRSADELTHQITLWLDGAQRRAKALTLVKEAENLIPQVQNLLQQARILEESAKSELLPIPPWAKEEQKAPAWKKKEKASQLSHQAALKIIASEQLLHAAITYAPQLPEAHAALATRYREQHEQAEKNRDLQTISRTRALLQTHASALPTSHLNRATHFEYLKGDGALSIHTDPPGVEVLLHRYEKQNLRLRPVFLCSLGKTPIVEYGLPMGSYLLLLRRDGYEEVRYPVCIRRQEHWDGVPPLKTEALAISMPPKGTLNENESYVPSGWYWSGGDKEAVYGLPLRKIWVDGFVCSRFPVTNNDYLHFLNYLVRSGSEEKALQCVPVENVNRGEKIVYQRDKNGFFTLGKDIDGDFWESSWPVLKVNWNHCSDFAQFLSITTSHKWRLPSELEWEKAAGGVDGRRFPWGDFVDPSWTCIRESHTQKRLPISVYSTPIDVSPFGIYGTGGNARDWTCSIFSVDGPVVQDDTAIVDDITSKRAKANLFYTVKGGAWFDQDRFVRVGSRSSELQNRGNSMLSFRLVRPLNW